MCLNLILASAWYCMGNSRFQKCLPLFFSSSSDCYLWRTLWNCVPCGYGVRRWRRTSSHLPQWQQRQGHWRACCGGLVYLYDSWSGPWGMWRSEVWTRRWQRNGVQWTGGLCWKESAILSIVFSTISLHQSSHFLKCQEFPSIKKSEVLQSLTTFSVWFFFSKIFQTLDMKTT